MLLTCSRAELYLGRNIWNRRVSVEIDRPLRSIHVFLWRHMAVASIAPPTQAPSGAFSLPTDPLSDAPARTAPRPRIRLSAVARCALQYLRGLRVNPLVFLFYTAAVAVTWAVYPPLGILLALAYLPACIVDVYLTRRRRQ